MISEFLFPFIVRYNLCSALRVIFFLKKINKTERDSPFVVPLKININSCIRGGRMRQGFQSPGAVCYVCEVDGGCSPEAQIRESPLIMRSNKPQARSFTGLSSVTFTSHFITGPSQVNELNKKFSRMK